MNKKKENLCPHSQFSCLLIDLIPMVDGFEVNICELKKD
jgi:hypothetical protein